MSTTNPSAQTALLVMDVQPSTVERYAQNSDLLPRLAQTMAAARAATIPVLYVRVKFRQGYPDCRGNSPVHVAAAPQLVL